MTSPFKVLPLNEAARLLQDGTAAKSTQVDVMVSPCCQPCCRRFVLCVACVHAVPADNHCNCLQCAG